MTKAPIYYYDFYVGVPNSQSKAWKYQALKLAAHDPEMAVYTKLLLYIGSNPPRTRVFNLKGHNTDLLYNASFSVRLIVEFELAHIEG
ncbi:hypothetical protein [Aureispira anguillae]|uniref:Uncharacterized protein n=1 Tax=Aureispira anguillae TaxID=2864201 RepID=A0A915YDN2_9BACT|nr:hypothetical protein [Aureispira anguillae]BDS11168.1 hypothetical protein AsAng_0018790 [Aureispira anguillae]